MLEAVITVEQVAGPQGQLASAEGDKVKVLWASHSSRWWLCQNTVTGSVGWTLCHEMQIVDDGSRNLPPADLPEDYGRLLATLKSPMAPMDADMNPETGGKGRTKPALSKKASANAPPIIEKLKFLEKLLDSPTSPRSDELDDIGMLRSGSASNLNNSGSRNGSTRRRRRSRKNKSIGEMETTDETAEPKPGLFRKQSSKSIDESKAVSASISRKKKNESPPKSPADMMNMFVRPSNDDLKFMPDDDQKPVLKPKQSASKQAPAPKKMKQEEPEEEENWDEEDETMGTVMRAKTGNESEEPNWAKKIHKENAKAIYAESKDAKQAPKTGGKTRPTIANFQMIFKEANTTSTSSKKS